MVGESGINALVALGHGVPIVLVTGDDITAEEAAKVSPGIHAAVVKTAVSRFAADSMHPDEACELIRDRAADAVRTLDSAAPPAIELPATLEVGLPQRRPRRHGHLGHRRRAVRHGRRCG